MNQKDPNWGLGSGPGVSGVGAGTVKTVNSNLSVNLNVEGMPQDQAEEFVTKRMATAVQDVLDKEYRETVRDGAGVLAN